MIVLSYCLDGLLVDFLLLGGLLIDWLIGLLHVRGFEGGGFGYSFGWYFDWLVNCFNDWVASCFPFYIE